MHLSRFVVTNRLPKRTGIMWLPQLMIPMLKDLEEEEKTDFVTNYLPKMEGSTLSPPPNSHIDKCRYTTLMGYPDITLVKKHFGKYWKYGIGIGRT